MAITKNGRMFSSEFTKATVVNSDTRLLAQTPNEPVEYVDLEQVAEVVNEGMLSKQEAANTYATKTGEYKELTAGFAYEILGDGQATSEKFSFRPTGGPNRNVRDGSARIELLKGNSVVWNQPIERIFIQESIGLSLTYDKGILTINGTATGQWYYGALKTSAKNSEHSYFLSVVKVGGSYTKASGGTRNLWINNGYEGWGGDATGTNNWQIFKGSTDYYYGIVCNTGDVFENCKLSVKLHDLTQMFGAGKEPTTIEQFYELLPEGVDINAYNTGEIVDGNYKAIKTTGFNQFNGTYAKVLGGVKYYLGGTYTSIGYTTEKGGTTEAITLPTSTEIVGTTPSDRLYTPSQNGYIYAQGTDICINIAWDEYSALNGTYKPYKPFERDLSWVNKYFPATINGETKYGMRRAGNVADEMRFNPTTQQWEAVQRVGVRAYQSGDDADTAVTTDGKNTNYALATPDVKTITEDVNLAYDVADYGTEQLIVAEGAQSAPLSAEVVYEPNVLASIKQVATMLTRLDALETAVATMQASAVATTNEE